MLAIYGTFSTPLMQMTIPTPYCLIFRAVASNSRRCIFCCTVSFSRMHRITNMKVTGQISASDMLRNSTVRMFAQPLIRCVMSILQDEKGSSKARFCCCFCFFSFLSSHSAAYLDQPCRCKRVLQVAYVGGVYFVCVVCQIDVHRTRAEAGYGLLPIGCLCSCHIGSWN